MKCLILAAGKGTRLGALTEHNSKVMMSIAGKPCLERIVEYLEGFGITEVVVNVHWNYQKIVEYFGNRLLYSYEPELLGTAGTVRRLLSWLGKRFLVLNGDTLQTTDLKDFLNKFDLVNPGAMTTYCEKTKHNAGIMGLTDRINWPEKGMIDDVVKQWSYYLVNDYYDIGTPEKLEIARKYYGEKESRLLS